MDTNEFVDICKKNIVKAVNCEFGNAIYGRHFVIEDVKAVWLSKTLKNIKGCFYVVGLKDEYYEMTYNGHENELYMDDYEKVSGKVIRL